MYARVSTTYGQNPEVQLAELWEYSSRREWTVTGEYIDEGRTRQSLCQPEELPPEQLDVTM